MPPWCEHLQLRLGSLAEALEHQGAERDFKLLASYSQSPSGRTTLHVREVNELVSLLWVCLVLESDHMGIGDKQVKYVVIINTGKIMAF